MAWIVLVVAGLFEVVWALFLKQSDGFSRPGPTIAFGITLLISMGLLSQALRSLPVGTAYAIWTGIGAAGTAVLGMILFGESRDMLKLVSLALIIAGIIGLRLATGEPTQP